MAVIEKEFAALKRDKAVANNTASKRRLRPESGGGFDAWLRNDQRGGNDDLMDYMCPPTLR